MQRQTKLKQMAYAVQKQQMKKTRTTPHIISVIQFEVISWEVPSPSIDWLIEMSAILRYWIEI